MAPDPIAALRARNLRVTPQRRAILGAFSDRPDEHLAADEVHARAAAAVPEVGRGTVYATLAELTELGLLAAVGSPEPVRYETNVSTHDHFRCRRCLRLFDVEVGAPDTSGLTATGFVVERVDVVVDGICGDCGDYQRGLHDGAAGLRDGAQLGEELVGTLACRRHDSPVGPLLLAASANGIVRVAFEDQADFAQLGVRATTRRGAREARERLDHAVRAFDAYFAGDRAAASDVVDWSVVPSRAQDALEATREIAYGGHTSYPRVCGTATAYDCGFAMGANPMPVLFPCHRVTMGAQSPDDYVGGLDRRDLLHELERQG